MSSYNLIGICGSTGAGKNTLSDYLVKKYGYTKISFDENMHLDTFPRATTLACGVVIFFTESQLNCTKMTEKIEEMCDRFFGFAEQNNDEEW